MTPRLSLYAKPKKHFQRVIQTRIFLDAHDLKPYLTAGLLAFFGLSGTLVQAQAKNFALVVGIDDYDVVSDLAGAVNDATWLAQSLAEFGVSELTLLANAEATRERIKSTFFAYLDMASAGDVVIFTFAGHGRPVPDTNGDEPTHHDPHDTEDETLILAGFSRSNPNEELLDDELSSWFAEAHSRGVRVIFLADSCFSGTVSRGGRLRRVDDFALDIPSEIQSPVRSSAFDENPENLIFLSGAPETNPVQEILVNGRFHGALSYAFGVALKGMRSDLDSDGAISRDELGRYLIRSVRGHNDGRVLPEIVAKLGEDFPVLTPAPDAKEFVIEMPPPNGLADLQADRKVGEISLTYRPDLVWNETTGDIKDLSDETVAKAVELARLPDVEAKFQLLALAREALIQRSFDISLDTSAQDKTEVLEIGDGFQISAGPLPFPYLTMFNLANNGEVQLIYPLDNAERQKQRIGASHSFDATASDPIGIDHIVAFATEQDPVTLRQQLNWNMSAEQLIATIDKLTIQDGVAVGITSVFTKEVAKHN
jgi:hypothetical protein